MGGGALLQLALYGSADVILTGSPQVSYFRMSFRRYTLFSSESLEMAFQGNAQFSNRCSAPLTKVGDLANQVWLQITLPDLQNYRYAAAQTPTTTVPAIMSARWASSTTVSVRLIPPTTAQANSRYAVTISPANASNVTTFYSTTTTVTITGLVKTTTYTVVAKRQLMSGETVSSEGSNSASMPIVALKWCNSIGHALVKSAELEIGGSRVDRHTSEFFDIWNELAIPEDKREGFEEMVGKYRKYDVYDNSFMDGRTLYVPLTFAMCESPSMSLPLLAIQFQDAKINFEFRDYIELIKSNVQISALYDEQGNTPTMTCKMFTTFYFLDSMERRRFTTMPMESLLTQLQILGDAPIIVTAQEPNLTRKISLNFSHPVKEIFFVYMPSASYNSTITTSEYAVLGNDYFNYNLPSPYEDLDPIISAKLQINGSDRFSERPGSYFRRVQPYQHHVRIPYKKVYTYSFGLNSQEFCGQPSGSLNFSRADSAHLIVSLNPVMMNGQCNGRILCYAINYQVARIGQGLFGIAFSG